MKSLLVSLAGVIVLGVTLASATQNPTPFVNQPLVPSAVAPGGAGFTLTVNGTGFVSGSTVNWNGSPRTTTFVSASQVTASILSSDITTAATGSVTVVSPAPGGGISNVVFLPVREPAGFVSLNQSTFGTPNTPGPLACADFNKDGKQDTALIVFENTPLLSILLGNGDGTFSQGSEYHLPGGPLYSLLAADINGDGNLDLILTAGLRGLIVLLGNGDGTFQQFVEYPKNKQLVHAAIGDFNRDGALDIAAVTTTEVCMFFGSGSGTFQPARCGIVSKGAEISGVVAGDFNGDGILDLAIASQCCADDAGVFILLGNGDGTFSKAHTYTMANGASSLTTADFNGDGDLDLAVTNQGIDMVSVFLGNGAGGLQPPSNFATALEPGSVTAADVNGDGALDLVVGDNGLNVASVSVLLGNGDGTFQNYTDYDGSGEGYLVLSDFNNDGRLDVAVANNGFNTVTVLTQDDGSNVELSANKLIFPLQLVGTVSDPKLIFLTNTGSSPIAISNIGVTANFSQLNNCKTVQPGHSCKIAVYFTPTAPGNTSSYLVIADDGGGSPQLVALTGVATIVSTSPSRLDFGSWPVGHVSTSQKVVVTNEGSDLLTISQIGIEGPNSKDFSEVNACPVTLAAGASCTISVIFHPSAKGARSATLGIVDSGGGSPQKVPLTGTGT